MGGEGYPKLWRSALYLPASKLRVLEKARTLEVDALIFDLEDAVAPEEKTRARAQLLHVLANEDFGPRHKIIRINGFDTEWGRDDAAAIGQACASGTAIDAVLLSKVNAASDLESVAQALPAIPLWAMIETCKSVLNVVEIAAHPRLHGMVMGTNDLQRELGARLTTDRRAMQHALGQCLLAARAYGRVIFDGVYPAFKDAAGFALECEQGRDMGFDGKSIIHPEQIEIANRAFGPSAAELDLARRQIAAYRAVLAAGEGVAVVDDKIVESLHVIMAEALLAKAAAITALAQSAAIGQE